MFCIIHQLLYILKFVLVVLLHYMYMFWKCCMLYRIYLHYLSYYVHTVLYTVFLFVIYYFVCLKQQLFAFAKSGDFFSFAYFWIGFDQNWKNHWILLQQSGRLVVPKFQMHKQCVLHSTHMIPHSIPLFGTSIFTTTSKVSKSPFLFIETCLDWTLKPQKRKTYHIIKCTPLCSRTNMFELSDLYNHFFEGWTIRNSLEKWPCPGHRVGGRRALRCVVREDANTRCSQCGRGSQFHGIDIKLFTWFNHGCLMFHIFYRGFNG